MTRTGGNAALTNARRVILIAAGCCWWARETHSLLVSSGPRPSTAWRRGDRATIAPRRLRILAAFEAGADDRPPAEKDAGANDASLSPLLDAARDSALREDRRIAQNWREASWTGRGFTFRGVNIRCVQMRESTDLSFGSDDGTVYGVDLGTERVAEFVRMEPAVEGGDTVAELGGVTLRDVQGGKAGLEMLVSGTTRTRIDAEYVGGHEGPVTALYSEGAALVSGGADGRVCVWTNRAQRTGAPITQAESTAAPTTSEGAEEEPTLEEALAAMGAVIEKTPKRQPLMVFSTHSPFTTLGQPYDYCKPSAVVGLVRIAEATVGESGEATGTLVAGASRDGLVQIWDVDSMVPVGKPVAVLPRANEEEGSNENCGVTCVAALPELGCLAVGTDDGRVVVIAVADLLAAPAVAPGDALSQDIATPPPLCAFEAHGGGAVTALVSGSTEEPLPSSLPGATAIVTGGANGEVKQFELFRDGGGTLRHWPQLGSQKLQRRAHRINAHEGAVTCLYADATKIISACAADGSIYGFKRSSGEELLRMEGFDANLSTIAVCKDSLVCDGMGETLCVHDFAEFDDELDAILSRD